MNKRRGHPRKRSSTFVKMVAIDPRSGLHLRNATRAERLAYEAANAGRPAPRTSRAFDQPVRVGDVLIDSYHGPGAWHGGAGF